MLNYDHLELVVLFSIHQVEKDYLTAVKDLETHVKQLKNTR